MKNVVLLGSTGSIGTSTLKVADDLPDRLRIIGMAAGGLAVALFGRRIDRRPGTRTSWPSLPIRLPRISVPSSGG